MSAALLVGRSTGATASWTWSAGIGWAARSTACPCPAPAPQTGTILWRTSDSPVTSSESRASPHEQPPHSFYYIHSTEDTSHRQNHVTERYASGSSHFLHLLHRCCIRISRVATIFTMVVLCSVSRPETISTHKCFILVKAQAESVMLFLIQTNKLNQPAHPGPNPNPVLTSTLNS